MYYKIIVTKRWVSKGFSAIALYPFILLHPENAASEQLLNHEKIHLRQQLELLVFFFYLWYVLEYLYRTVRDTSRRKAYRNLSFEKEAYEKEGEPDYLSRRKPYAFLKFM